MIGKDYWIGRLVWWWLLTRPGSLVMVTGPSQTSLGSITWKEVRQATPRWMGTSDPGGQCEALPRREDQSRTWWTWAMAGRPWACRRRPWNGRADIITVSSSW